MPLGTWILSCADCRCGYSDDTLQGTAITAQITAAVIAVHEGAGLTVRSGRRMPRSKMLNSARLPGTDAPADQSDWRAFRTWE